MGAGLAVDENDARITRVGALLRRTSLDELPNLVNVLRGDMSLIGPRPTLPVQVAQYTERQRGRLAIKPGITGWAQVNGRASLPWAERIELDLYYIEHRSLRARRADPVAHGRDGARRHAACTRGTRAAGRASCERAARRPASAPARARPSRDPADRRRQALRHRLVLRGADQDDRRRPLAAGARAVRGGRARGGAAHGRPRLRARADGAVRAARRRRSAAAHRPRHRDAGAALARSSGCRARALGRGGARDLRQVRGAPAADARYGLPSPPTAPAGGRTSTRSTTR